MMNARIFDSYNPFRLPVTFGTCFKSSYYAKMTHDEYDKLHSKPNDGLLLGWAQRTLLHTSCCTFPQSNNFWKVKKTNFH